MVSAACLLLDRERLLVMLQAPLVLVLALQHLSTRTFVPEDRLSNAGQTPYKTTGEILIAFPSSFGATAPNPGEIRAGYDCDVVVRAGHIQVIRAQGVEADGQRLAPVLQRRIIRALFQTRR